MAHLSARQLALAAFREWRTGQTFADSILGRLLRSSDLAGKDRAFATELFYGILRNITLLDFWIASLRSEHLDDTTRDLLRLGLYQLFLLNTPEHAAVHETVDLAGARTRPLVNAVLRNAVRRKEALVEKASRQNLSTRSSHPEFLIERWTQNFGAEKAAALCEWNNCPPPIYARINRLKITVDKFLLEYSEAEQSTPFPDFVRLASVPASALAQGYCYIQDPSTAAACTLLDPSPGDRVLDACAAPGGKTTFLAELMDNQGVIVACDRDAGRIRTLRGNLERMGVKIALPVQHDWTGDEALPNAAASSLFDRILVDAPCSNTGVMRRRIDLRWRLVPKDVSRMQAEQLRIVRAVIPLLKTGGALVYSTCSIEPEENEEVARTVIHEFPFMKLSGQVSLFPFRDGLDGAYAAEMIREN